VRVLDHRLLVFTLLALLTIVRLIWLKFTGLALAPDEAQYWFWSKNLDWGFYSKPPMVALLINFSTKICGDSEACIRTSSPLLYFFTSLAVYGIGKELFTTRVGLWSAVTFATLPAVFLSSALVSTDPVLLFFWSLTLYTFICALRRDSWCLWLIVGVFAGLGMLSKYNMLVFLLSAIVFLLWAPTERKHLASYKFWTAALLAFLIWLPNLVWNLQNGLVSFYHTVDLAGANTTALFNIYGLLKFFGGQFAVFGPILFGVLLYSSFQLLRQSNKQVEYKFLLVFSLVFLGLIMLVALKSRAHANWAAPAFIAASVLVCAYLIEINKVGILKLSLGLHLVLSAFGLLYPVAAAEFDVQLNSRFDPVTRLQNNRDLGKEVSELLQQNPGAVLAVDERKLLASLLYYSTTNIYKWNPEGAIRDHFDLTTNLKEKVNKDIIFIGESYSVDGLKAYANSVQQLRILTYNNKHIYKVFLLQGFKGY
jgi:4-amino-4-deoxy-L-arabinose transferase-like glycosyltransferase